MLTIISKPKKSWYGLVIGYLLNFLIFAAILADNQ